MAGNAAVVGSVETPPHSPGMSCMPFFRRREVWDFGQGRVAWIRSFSFGKWRRYPIRHGSMVSEKSNWTEIKSFHIRLIVFHCILLYLCTNFHINSSGENQKKFTYMSWNRVIAHFSVKFPNNIQKMKLYILLMMIFLSKFYQEFIAHFHSVQFQYLGSVSQIT